MSYRDFREIILCIVLAALSRQDPNNGLYHTLFSCPHMPKDCGSSQSSPYGLMIKNRPRTLFVYRALPQQRSSISSDFIVNFFNPSRPVLLLLELYIQVHQLHPLVHSLVRHALSYQY